MSAQAAPGGEMLAHALDYAARGWPVFPCGADKKPLVAGGFKSANIHANAIEGWWTRWPDALIGVPMGSRSGVFAIDPDVSKSPGDPDGLAAWRSLAAAHGGHGHTHTHLTPSGGEHILFRWRSDRPVTNSPGSLPAGVDVGGEGGYIIVAPSRLPDGRAYRLAESFGFFTFAEAPDWLLTLIETKPEKPRHEAPPKPETDNVHAFPGAYDRYVRAALNRECDAVARTGTGGRNEALNRAAFSLGTLVGAGHLDSRVAADRLLEAAKSCGLVADDGIRPVMATIESGMTGGAAHPREMPEPRKNRPRRERSREDRPEQDPGGSDDKPLMEDTAALRFAELYDGRLRYCHDHGAWFEWIGSHWRRNGTGLAFHFARELSRELAQHEEFKTQVSVGKAAFAGSVERFARADPRFAVTAEAWDADPFLLGTPGGTVDLKTGRLRPATAADGVTKVTAIAPADRADCPLWLRFLAETTGSDAEMIRFMQQWAGYALTGDTREHALVFVFGDCGNGKSVFMNVLTGIVNDYATTAAMSTFIASHGEQHPTDLAMLRGARLVSASETEEGRQWAESRIKQMTGGDHISARFMRQDFFTFRPSFKLTIIGNHKPGLKSVDDAARRRFNLVPFTRKPAVPDRQLEEKLRAEWPGILRWMIEGCLDWQANGLARPASVTEATRAYFDEQDVMSEWMAEKCIVDRGNDFRKSTTQELFTSWSAFAKANNEMGGTVRAFSQKLQKLGFEQIKNVPQFGGGRSRGFAGIDLRHDPAGASHG